MKQSDRHARILQELRLTRFRSVVELAEAFEVSEETIRRDLRRLEELGEVEKVHGGVMLREQGSDAPFQQRIQSNLEAKTRIARALTEMIPDGATLFIDGGSTCCVAARGLVARPSLKIVTCSTEIARLVAGVPDPAQMLLAPGEIDPEDLCLYGPATAEWLARFRCNYAVLSASAVNADDGFLDFKPREAEIKRVMLRQSERVVVLADSTKFGRRGFARFAAPEDVDILVTEAQPTAVLGARLAGADVAMHITDL